MRRLLLLAIAVTLPACAPLIDFDALSSGEGGPPADASKDGNTTADAGDAAEALGNCGDAAQGFYCGFDKTGPQSYPRSRANDLVHCELDGGIRFEKACVLCLQTPFGNPDACDECAGKPDGRYCGNELDLYPAELRTDLKNVEFDCANGVSAGPPSACAMCKTGGLACQ